MNKKWIVVRTVVIIGAIVGLTFLVGSFFPRIGGNSTAGAKETQIPQWDGICQSEDLFRGKSLLYLFQANVNPANEEAFDTWHNAYLRNLTKIPGVRWANRYVGAIGDIKYLSLCEIDDASYLPSLLGDKPGERNPIANADLQKLFQLQGVTWQINVYEQLIGTPVGIPLFLSDRPISVVEVNIRPDREAQWNYWYNTSHMPNLLRLSGYVNGARFRLVKSHELNWLKMKPKYNAIYELEGPGSIQWVGNTAIMDAAHLAELQNWVTNAGPYVSDVEWNIYTVAARFWKF